MKKPDKRYQARIINVGYPRAKKDYECYGCDGECPVPKGEWYMKVTCSWQGKIYQYRYCQRCACAMENRIDHSSKGVTIQGKGALKLRLLSNAFRKKWQEFCLGLQTCKTDEEGKKLQDMFLASVRGGRK